MSVIKVESFEYLCDGHCGAKKVMPRVGRIIEDVPPMWIDVKTSDDKDHKHFCGDCWSLLSSLAYNNARKLRYLAVLTPDELEDFGLEDLLGKLQGMEKMCAASGKVSPK